MLQVMISIMMIIKNYAENHGKNIIIIFVLVDLKKEIKEDFVYVIKAKKVNRSNTSDESSLKTNDSYSSENPIKSIP